MLRPSPDDVAAAKVECRKRFGHERVLGIPLGSPIDLYVIVAAMGLRDAATYDAARAAQPVQARSALVADRALWPAQKDIAARRVLRGALDAKIEVAVRVALGWSDDPATVLPFSVATAPPGFAAPADIAAKVEELRAAWPAAELWSVTNAANGLALVIAAAEEDVYTAAVAAFGQAQQQKAGTLTTLLGFVKDLVVWSPKPLDAYLDEAPGRAEDIGVAFLEMGGAGAAGSATFL